MSTKYGACKICNSPTLHVLKDIGCLLICKQCLYNMCKARGLSSRHIRKVYLSWEKDYVWDEYLERKGRMDSINSRRD